jgi:4-pyridoxate dehydrogenase
VAAFDYIIVGAGSAGCVLAARLTEDPATRVLLLEAGGSDAHPYVRVPLGVGALMQQRIADWMYDTQPEAELGDRALPLPRGKVVGGSSSVNYLVYTRGHPGDFERWVRNGATGWSWNEVLPYFKRSETWAGGASRVRGGSGPLRTEFTRAIDPVYDAMLAAAETAGFPITADYNGERPLGFGRAQLTVGDGRRSSAWRAYIHGIRHERKNLTILTHAHARRVVFDGTTARGVEYEQQGTFARADATREVLLCGGSINTPQTLMLSGIGPAAHLREHGIAALADLPVGDNLQDHWRIELAWERRSRGPFHRSMRFDRAARSMAQAYLFGSGPGTAIPFGLHAFIETVAGLDAPDVELLLRGAPRAAQPWFPGIRAPYTDGFGIAAAIMHPQSRGTIRLRFTNPSDAPLIAYNALTAPADLIKLRECVRLVRTFAHQPALDSFRGPEMVPGAEVTSDAAIDAYIRATTGTVSHPVGTCKMGTDAAAVLDPELRVRGIDALRVVDGSALPDLVSAHTNACIIMMAEGGRPDSRPRAGGALRLQIGDDRFGCRRDRFHDIGQHLHGLRVALLGHLHLELLRCRQRVLRIQGRLRGFFRRNKCEQVRLIRRRVRELRAHCRHERCRAAAGSGLRRRTMHDCGQLRNDRRGKLIRDRRALRAVECQLRTRRHVHGDHRRRIHAGCLARRGSDENGKHEKHTTHDHPSAFACKGWSPANVTEV